MKVGYLFKVQDKGFDYMYDVKESEYSSRVVQTHFFKPNYLHYLEIVDVKKLNRKKKYKVRLFSENTKVTNNLWHWGDEELEYAEELFRWLPGTVLKQKIKMGSIIPCEWYDVAKDELLK